MKQYSPFRFKQFSIEHDRAAMKIGTDSILLGAWTKIYNHEYILDIGTGTGLLSIMLAQKVHGKCRIDAIEIDKDALHDAALNINNCPWRDSIELHAIDFMEYDNNVKYDLIISNPPFYEGLLSPNISRNKARNARESLNFEMFLKKSSNLLKWDGRLSMILPFEISKKIISEAKKNNLFPIVQVNIRPRSDKKYNRTLLEFRKTKSNIEMTNDELCIVQANSNTYSSEFRKLTIDFYLQ